MIDNEWISSEKRLPGINSKVELKFNDGAVLYGRFRDFNMDILTHWRYPHKKRPDFSKLKDGDLLLIYSPQKDLAEDRVISGLFVYQNGIILGLSSSWSGHMRYPTDVYMKESIKKITRINIENQTFEEI